MAGPEVMTVMAQVTIADLLTIVSVPIVLQPSRVRTRCSATCSSPPASCCCSASRALEGLGWVHRLRRLSKHRRWALDLRLSLLALFLLAWVAQKGGTSVLIAGFGAGLMVALVGGPKRLSTQMRGVAEGFFIPLYFVVLGAELDLGGLFDHAPACSPSPPRWRRSTSRSISPPCDRPQARRSGLIASAQLGVPAAIASLGLAEQLLSPGVATAIVAAALISLGVCTLGVERLARRPAAPAAAPPPEPEPAA